MSSSKISHLEVIEALPDNQSAYRKLYSTETDICSAVNHMLEMMNENKCGILILLNVSAAFDIVVHELLLNEIRSIGVEAQAFKYLKDYLDELHPTKFFHITLNGETSKAAYEKDQASTLNS
ncbi:uncharacterized protein [Palaemon carinicauda]|uniref:uncharacterized protein n=1 Tax=Palaemon carinicauda TaxID=392227 RepID=UPI0035B5BBE6